MTLWEEKESIMPRRRKPITQSPMTGIGLDPEADATARAEAESPEGEALYQEIKRMEALAGSNNHQALGAAAPAHRMTCIAAGRRRPRRAGPRRCGGRR